MAKITKTSMKDQAYEILRERILNGEYSFGESISILGLTNELGISNTPIREALNMLATEGLITNKMNNKFHVIEPSEEDMDELNDAVLTLLVGGYIMADRQGKIDKLPEMLEKAIKLQKEDLEVGRERDYINHTIQFDRCFVEITGNNKLINAYESFNNLLFLYVVHTYWKSEDNLMKKLKEHEELIKVVKEGNRVAVVDLLEKHFDEHYGK